MSIGWQLLLIAFCMAGSAFFSGIETGVISIHRMRLRHFVRESLPGAATLQWFLDHSDRLLGTTLVGNNICNVIVSVVSASIAVGYLGAWGEPSATVLVAMLLLVFCEYLPKTWFQGRPLDRCRRFAGLLRISEVVFRPLSTGAVWLTRWLVPGPSKSLPESVPFVTREDLKILAREGEKDGVLSPRERVMIHRVFELSAKRAHQIMVPRSEMVYVNEKTTVAGFFETARQSKFTRIPVYDAGTDTFTGVINVFYVLSRKADPDQKAAPLARPPLFVGESMPIDDILPLMRRFRHPMCLVKNSEEKIVGLITTEDILEEIVGTL